MAVYENVFEQKINYAEYTEKNHHVSSPCDIYNYQSLFTTQKNPTQWKFKLIKWVANYMNRKPLVEKIEFPLRLQLETQRKSKVAHIYYPECTWTCLQLAFYPSFYSKPSTSLARNNE